MELLGSSARRSISKQLLDLFQSKPVKDLSLDVEKVGKHYKDAIVRLFVPLTFRGTTTSEANDTVTGGHQGVGRTLNKVVHVFW